ncbi:MAG: hypothetical protein IID46_07935 [Planctomycetes bacterium]|nr:hypothetical protein [Planctomycetota bacterium]
MYHYELRNTDLVVEVGPGQWVLLISAPTEEAVHIIQRLHDAREQSNNQRLLEQLPAIHLEIIDHWQMPISADEIEIRFNKARSCLAANRWRANG